MRKAWVLVCCVLVILALMMMTTIDARKAADKKNKKQSKNDSPKDNSSKSKSKEEKQSDVNPKMKPFQNKQVKKKTEKKIQNDSAEIPVLSSDKPDIQFRQEKLEQPVVEKTLQNTTLEQLPPPNCSAPAGNLDKLEAIEKNVTSLWRHLSIVSQPVHIHVHGDHVSSAGGHKNHGCQGRCHGDRSRKGHTSPEKDRNKLSDKRKHQPHSHDHTRRHSHSRSHGLRHCQSHKGHPRVRDGDKSHSHNTTTSHKHHNHTSYNHTHHVHRLGDRSHKSHHHSKHHSHTSHNHTHHVHRSGDRSHKSHHHSKHHSHTSHNHTHHVHRSGDRSHKSHHHSKRHSHGCKFARGHDYSPSKDHYHRGGHGYGDRSTHVHIHLTIDEKPSPVQTETNQSTIAPVLDESPIFGRCDLRNYDINNNLIGYVLFLQSSGVLAVKVNITGFPVSANGSGDPAYRLHGFHVHEFGDFSNGCLSFGSHYNPEGTTHGGLNHDIRHVGDWGNIAVDRRGQAVRYFTVRDATLQGPHSILGRGIVVHEHADDLGEGHIPASKTTGNAGGRLACCVIGHSKPLPVQTWEQ